MICHSFCQNLLSFYLLQTPQAVILWFMWRSGSKGAASLQKGETVLMYCSIIFLFSTDHAKVWKQIFIFKVLYFSLIHFFRRACLLRKALSQTVNSTLNHSVRITFSVKIKSSMLPACKDCIYQGIFLPMSCRVVGQGLTTEVFLMSKKRG